MHRRSLKPARTVPPPLFYSLEQKDYEQYGATDCRSYEQSVHLSVTNNQQSNALQARMEASAETPSRDTTLDRTCSVTNSIIRRSR